MAREYALRPPVPTGDLYRRPRTPAEERELEELAAGLAERVPLPLAGYDLLTLASLRARLRVLSPDDLAALIAHEKAHQAREDFTGMLERRIATVARSRVLREEPPRGPRVPRVLGPTITAADIGWLLGVTTQRARQIARGGGFPAPVAVEPQMTWERDAVEAWARACGRMAGDAGGRCLMRPGDEKTATVLAMQDELTALGLLPRAPGGPVRALPPECGTLRAAWGHRRRGEPLDGWCADAEREDWRARLAAAKAARRAARPGKAPLAIPATWETLGDLGLLIAALARLAPEPDARYAELITRRMPLRRAA